VEPPIVASTSTVGCCPECLAPWHRTFVRDENRRIVPTGWEPGCDHPAADTPIPCTVLDPFLGSGTSGLVAKRLGRDFTGIELLPEYATLAQHRIEDG
jgi:hypothetical protein